MQYTTFFAINGHIRMLNYFSSSNLCFQQINIFMMMPRVKMSLVRAVAAARKFLIKYFAIIKKRKKVERMKIISQI